MQVRCDLEDRPSGICTRCQHEGRECQLHIGPRKQKALRTSLAGSNVAASSPIRAVPTTVREITPQETPSSSFSVLGNQPPNCSSAVNGGNYSRQQTFVEGSELIIDISRACLLPPPVIAQALADF